MILSQVSTGVQSFPDFTRNQQIANAQIYVGQPDLDPAVLVNQYQVYIVQEDGTQVAAPQPIRTGAGGVPTYNGSPVQIAIEEGVYSVKILSSLGSQIYYQPRNDDLSLLVNSITAPNGFSVNTDDLSLNSNGDFGVGASIGGITTYGSGFKVVDVNSADGSYVQVRSANVRVDMYADEASAVGSIGTKNAHPLTVRVTDGEMTRFTTAGYIKVSNDASDQGISGLSGSYLGGNSHGFISSSNDYTVFAGNSSSGSASSANFGSFLNAGVAHNHFRGLTAGTAVFAVAQNGNVTNTNNSYGAISARKFKDLLEEKTGADYVERYKQVKFWTYTLKADPTNQKLLGVVAEELGDIFPSLVTSTPETREVKKTRKVSKEVQVTERKQRKKTEIVEVDGKFVKTQKTEWCDCPVVEEHTVFDGSGKNTGEVHLVYKTETVEVDEEYVEFEETGEVTLSVNYSILNLIASMITQTLIEKVEDLTARIEALENA